MFLGRVSSQRLLQLALAVLSMSTALVVAEYGVRLTRRAAFPFLNIFVADAAFGVVLEPNQQTKTRSRTGKITEVRTNAQGFRDTPWLAAYQDSATHHDSAAHQDWATHHEKQRILLLGDSQMFGYGVDVEDAVDAQLEKKLGSGFEVLNAAVPTWGPPEYVLTVQRWVPRYKPSYVLFVANVANDWVEARVANTKRTTAEFGWATRVRLHQAPASTRFDLREILNRSHLYFLVRELGAYAQSTGLPVAHDARLLHKNLQQLRKSVPGYRSIVGPALADARNFCAQQGCRVIAVTLPLDVQVDAREWSKYHSQPIDVLASHILLQDFLQDARELGCTDLDLLPVLQKASPGAFLADDYHLSAQGHAAVAEVLAAQILGAAQ